MKKILVTGGAGFIGSNFVNLILNDTKEYQVVVLDKLTYAGNLKSLESWRKDSRFIFVKADIANKEEVFSIFQEHRFDYVAHFAAESHVDRSILGPEEFIKTNVLGTFYLLDAARLQWKGSYEGKKFLHVSTDEVFGTLGDTGYFTEETPYAPNSPYSASKAGSDHIVRSYFHTYHMPVVTTNCSNNYGPYHFPEKLIPLIILNCLQGKPLPVYGDGKNIRDWLYVKDHCEALRLALFQGLPGETYNIGTRNEKKNIDIVNSICSIMDELHPSGVPHSRLIQYVKDRPGHDFRYAIDPSKIEKELGWKPKFGFESALRETVQWYLDNDTWWKEIFSGQHKEYYENQYEKH